MARYRSAALHASSSVLSISGSFIFLSKESVAYKFAVIISSLYGRAQHEASVNYTSLSQLLDALWPCIMHNRARAALNIPQVDWNKVDAALCLELSAVFIWQC